MQFFCLDFPLPEYPERLRLRFLGLLSEAWEAKDFEEVIQLLHVGFRLGLIREDMYKRLFGEASLGLSDSMV